LAVNRSKQNHQTQPWDEVTSFFDVICWRELAENAKETLTKGSGVAVSGRVEQRSWETPDGERRCRIEVIPDGVGPSLHWATARSPIRSAAPRQPLRPIPPLVELWRVLRRCLDKETVERGYHEAPFRTPGECPAGHNRSRSRPAMLHNVSRFRLLPGCDVPNFRVVFAFFAASKCNPPAIGVQPPSLPTPGGAMTTEAASFISDDLCSELAQVTDELAKAIVVMLPVLDKATRVHRHFDEVLEGPEVSEADGGSDLLITECMEYSGERKLYDITKSFRKALKQIYETETRSSGLMKLRTALVEAGIDPAPG
jgi:hypothetical protein